MTHKKERRGLNLKRILLLLLAIPMVTTAVPRVCTEARAFDQGAFVGGMIAGHVVGGAIRRSKMRTAAEMHQAYGQPQVVQQQAPAAAPAPAPTHTHAAPAASAKPSAEQRIQQLDKLAAGGYITPEEYKTKKKAILDSL
jgi:hypothetical protein